MYSEGPAFYRTTLSLCDDCYSEAEAINNQQQSHSGLQRWVDDKKKSCTGTAMSDTKDPRALECRAIMGLQAIAANVIDTTKEIARGNLKEDYPGFDFVHDVIEKNDLILDILRGITSMENISIDTSDEFNEASKKRGR